MRRWLLSVTRLSAVGAVVGFIATPAASAQQSLNLYLGGFVPTSLDARGTTTGGRSNDVLVRDLDFLDYRFGRFTGPTFGGEWLVGLGDKFDAGLGIGFYQRTVPAADAKFVAPNGNDVVANLAQVGNALSRETERRAGLLQADLQYGRIDVILHHGLHAYLTTFLQRVNDLADRVSRDFLVPLATA